MSVQVLLALVVSAPFVIVLARSRVLRRLAFRSPRRRPIEALLVVVGSMLGTAIITGSLIIGDTMDRSVRASAYEQLGPVDVLVTIDGLLPPDEVAAAIEAIETAGRSSGAVDGAVPIVGVPVAVRGERNQPRAQLLELDFPAARALGADPASTGITGPTPGPGRAVLSEDLARRVDAATGDSVTVFVYGVPVELIVDRILPRQGLAGFWQLDDRQQAYNVFVTPGSLAAALAEVRLPDGVAPPVTHLAVSSPGSVEGAAALTDGAIDTVVTALGPGVTVRPVKQDLLAVADAVAASIADLYLTMGVFTVAAGVLLLVNIFVMLAEERRSQFGTLRALGMRRGSLVGSFATEGWLYALVSALLGALVGIQVGRIISWRAAMILDGGNELTSLRVTFAYDWGTVLDGFAIGLVVAVTTVVVTSVRLSRLNVIAAIRELPAAAPRGARIRTVGVGAAVLLAGVGLSVMAIAGRDAYAFAAGPMLAMVGAGLMWSTRVGARTATTVSALGVAAWGVVFVPMLDRLEMSVGVPIFVVQGIGMCSAGVGLLIAHQRALGTWWSRRGRGSPSVRLGLAYPLSRLFRTTATLTMFSLVVLTIVYLSSVSAMFGGSLDATAERIAGGWKVIVTSNPSDPVGAEEVRFEPGVSAVTASAYTIGSFRWRGDPATNWALTAVDTDFALRAPRLVDRGGHPDDASAWRALVDDPSSIIVDEFFLNSGGPRSVNPRIGDPVEVIDPVSGRSRTATVTALASTDFLFNGAFYGIDGARELLGSRAVTNRLWIDTDRPEALADELGRRFVANGADAVVIRSAVETALAETTGFFTIMEEYVAIGLLVGIAGIGVITVRAVRERRRDVAVLRSLGLDARSIRMAFLIEALFVAVSGTALGIAVGLIGSWSLTIGDLSLMEGATWVMPWGRVASVVVLVVIAVIISTVSPARSAGRIAPAAALRVAD